MLVKFTKDYDVAISRRSTKTYPAGWQGEVDDKVGADAVKRKCATDLTPKPAKDDGKGSDDGKAGGAPKA